MEELKLYKDGKITGLEAPLIACWDVTMVCNQSCTFCYNSQLVREGKLKLEHPQLAHQKRIIDALADAGVIELDLMGGDPLSIPHTQLKELIAYAVQKGIAVNIITNGLGAGKRFAEEIAPMVKDIGFSIHGPDAETHDRITGRAGNFERSVGNLVGVAKETKCGVGVLFSGIRSNLGRVEATVDEIVKRLGDDRDKLRYFYLNRMVCHEGSNAAANARETRLTHEEQWEMVKALVRIKQKYAWLRVETTDSFPACKIREWFAQDAEFAKEHTVEEVLAVIGKCHFGKTNVAVKSNGDVAVCTISQDSHAIGNLLQTPLRKIWKGALYSLYRSLEWMPEACRTACGDIASCLGGCKMGKKGPFGIDRLVGGDDIALVKEDGRSAQGPAHVQFIEVGSERIALRREGEHVLLYPVRQGTPFRPHVAALATDAEVAELKAGHKGAMRELQRIIGKSEVKRHEPDKIKGRK